jgi:CarboxypepD_reg-like domain
MLKSILGFTILILSLNLNAQSLSAKIIDKTTSLPVPYAAIQTGQHKGVISNEEGVFNIDLNNNSVQQITISSLGYKTQVASIASILNANYIIELEPAINELNTVYLSNKKPNVDSIIARVVRNLDKNYKAEHVNHKLFYRETSYMDFDNLDFEIKKASHVKKKQLLDANNNLKNMADNVMSSNFVHFTDFMGKLSIMTKDSMKLEVVKAAQIINSKKDFSLENIQERAQNIVLKYLDTTLTYKLKTGLFKIEDSLSLASDKDADIKKQDFEISDLKSKAKSILKDSKPSTKGLLKNILTDNNYSYTLKNVTLYNGEMVYTISYKPRKAKAKYAGTLYVSDDTYAILKTDYSYAKGKRGSKFNLRLLLGVKYIENISNGTIIFNKNTENWYEPRYIKHEEGHYFYVSRPLKFIENTSSRNKVLFDFKIEGTARNKEELLFTSTATITDATFNAITEAKTIPYQKQRKYDASLWGTNETLVPTEELKTFDASKDN